MTYNLGSVRRQGPGGPINRLLSVCLLLAMSLPAAGAALTGVTSHPNYSVFVRGEPIVLTFTADGLKTGQTGLLTVHDTDADGRTVFRKVIHVAADAAGKWTGSVPAPSDRLGYFQVTARLSTGEELPAVGSRGPGYLTYMVTVDPNERIDPGEDAFFGMQGGFTSAFDARPYLGIHWVLGDYRWGEEEPDHPGQFAERRQQLRAHPDPATQAERDTDRKLDILPVPTLLNGTPKWAVVGGKTIYTTGVLQDLESWRRYCSEVGRAAQEDYPYLKRHLFQITWEPVYPWGFPGTPEDLIRDYRVAYPALHAADPRAFVIGPTGAGISPGDLDWNETLFKEGIGRYLDGVSIHPYIGEPPEQHNLPGNIRALKEMIRTYTGRDLPLFGTEQGWATGGDPSKEHEQAVWLTRTCLIMMGEGFKVNFAFYFADYPGEPGYGFFHNLHIAKIPWGTDSVSPKPVAAAYAALTLLLEGHHAVQPIEWLGPTTLGYAYQRGSDVILALWDYGDVPHEVTLPVGSSSVELLDWMGNGRRVPTPGGSLRLRLGPTPQYVRGVAASLWGAGAARPLSIDPAHLSTFPGSTARFVASIPRIQGEHTALRIEPVPELGFAGGVRPVRAGSRSVPTLIPIRPDAPFGAYPVRIEIERNGRVAGLAAAMLRVEAPISVEGITPAGPTALKISLRSRRAVPIKGTLRIRLRGVPGTRKALAFSLPPSGAGIVTARFPGVPLDPARVYSAELSISDPSSHPLSPTVVESVDFLTAPRLAHPPAMDGSLAGWDGVSVLSLRGRDRVIRQPQLYGGVQDLSARFQYAWDAKALYLAAQVQDDRFVQEKEGYDTWQQDSLQLAFDAHPGKAAAGVGNVLAEAGGRGESEITLALTRHGPEAYRTITPDSNRLPVANISAADLPLVIKRVTDGLVYEAAIPWSTIGLNHPPAAGAVIGTAATVNDADDPAQTEPKALGLFGGITPTKDPALFGSLLLSAQGPAERAAEAAPRRLNVAGFLGQSGRRENPLPWTGCAGAMTDDRGRLWTTAGDRAWCFHDGSLIASEALPASSRMMRGDGRRMLVLGTDDQFYFFDTVTGKGVPLADAHSGTGSPRDIALALDGSFYALYPDGAVRGWTKSGQAEGELLKAAAGKNWSYISIGLDFVSGDLLLGSGYPDNRIYHYHPRASLSRTSSSAADWRGIVPGTSEVPEGFAVLLSNLQGHAWMLNEGGKAFPLAGAGQISGQWAYYPTGLAGSPTGSRWIACAQGLLEFDPAGNPEDRRIGGLADPGLIALGPDGTVVTLLEKGGRVVRLLADDEPDAALSCNANEPWRVGNGWTGRAAGIGWDGSGYLVLDSTPKRLWEFHPDKTAWGEQPWTAITREGAFHNPRALAVGDAAAFVLDGSTLLQFSLMHADSPGNPVPLPPGTDAAEIVAMASAGDHRLYLATRTTVMDLDPANGRIWEVSGFQSISGLASDDDVVVVDHAAARLVLLDGKDGKVAATLNSGQVPGGWAPVSVAAGPSGIFVTDTRGHRIVRIADR